MRAEIVETTSTLNSQIKSCLFFVRNLSSVLVDKLLLEVVRNKLVACKLRCERSTSSGKAAKRDRIVGKLLERNLSLELLIASLAIHTHDKGTTALKV